MTNQNPGDVEIINLTIDGKDFKDKILSIMVTEHIFTPMLKATVTLIQTEGDQSTFKFNDSSSATLSFRTPSAQTRTYDLIVNKVGNAESGESQRTRKFSVEMVSKHAAKAAATPNYQKAYKNQTIADYTKALVSELGIQNVDIGQTRGLQGGSPSEGKNPIITASNNPFAHLNNFKNMAVGMNQSDAMMMYSAIGANGQETFVFKPLTELLKGSGSETITNNTKFEINSQLTSTMWNNIIDKIYPQQRSALDNEALNKSHTNYKFGTGQPIQSPLGTSKQASVPGLNSAASYGFQPINGKGSSTVRLENPVNPPTYRGESQPNTEAILANMKTGGITLKIPGNSNIKVGDIVTLDLREDTDNFLNRDTRYNGKNIVNSVISFIGPPLDNPRYVTILNVTNIQPSNGTIK